MTSEPSITKDRRPKNISKVRWLISLVIMVPLVALWILLFSGSWKSFELISESMAPTLEKGDRVMMQPVTEGQDLMGRIVVFASVEPEYDGEVLTKRIIATGPTKVILRNGDLFVGTNPTAIPGENLYKEPNQIWNLESDELFVVGDNRANSHDSTEHGPIKRDAVVGVVTFRYFPLMRLGGVD